jgi:translation initiation factor IF-3
MLGLSHYYKKLNRKELTISEKKKALRVNEKITRVDQVLLINENGEKQGVVSISQALQSAKEAGLDLVEIVPKSEPPVCRVMDHGKFRFDQGKKKSDNKRKQKVSKLKEVKFRVVTDIGDFNNKVKNIMKFLDRGDKAKVTLRFKGREAQHAELGLEMVRRVKTAIEQESTERLLVVEQDAKLEGRQISMVLAYGKGNKK